MIVGILYDQYAPIIESQIIIDFIALSSEGTVHAAALDDCAKRALNSINIDLVLDINLAQVILRYKVGDEYPDIPVDISDDRVFDRDFSKRISSTSTQLELGNHDTPSLKEGGYPYVSNINYLRPIVPNGPISIDPTIIWLFGR